MQHSTITLSNPASAAKPQIAHRARLLVCSAGVPHESEGASIALFYHCIALLLRGEHRIRHLLLVLSSPGSLPDAARYVTHMADPADRDRFAVDAVRAATDAITARRYRKFLDLFSIAAAGDRFTIRVRMWAA